MISETDKKMSPVFAHSVPGDRDCAKWQPLEMHLKAVAAEGLRVASAAWQSDSLSLVSDAVGWAVAAHGTWLALSSDERCLADEFASLLSGER